MNVTINRYYWRGARGKKGQHKSCSLGIRMDEGWGLRSAARGTQSEAVLTLQARTAGYRQLARRLTANMTRAALPAQRAHTNSTSAFRGLLRLQLAQIQLYATALVRLIREGVFKDWLCQILHPCWVSRCVSEHWHLGISHLLYQTSKDATLNLIYFSRFWSKHFFI